MSRILIITGLTLHEAVRRRMVLVALVLGALFLLLYDTGMIVLLNDARGRVDNLGGIPNSITSVLGEQIFAFLLIVGLYVVHFLTMMLAIFASVDTLAGEIRSHTVQTLVTKPMRRSELLLGKWLGYALMLCGYMLLLAGGCIISVYLITGFLPPNILPALLLFALEALVLLSLSLLGGTRLSTLTNGVALFMLYGLAFIGSWIEQFGTLFQSHAAINVGIVASLVMPVESIWSLAAYLLQPASIHDLPPGLRFSPLLGTTSVPSAAMVIYAASYAAIMLALAIRSFARRDL
ncbi:MAG: ABC transporter permease [Chloroflexota bacterium]|nr:ABC transporter permease [Chloroflexota bacterium]